MGRHGSSRVVDDSAGLSEQLMKTIQKPCMFGDYGNYCTAEAHKKGLEEFDGTEWCKQGFCIEKWLLIVDVIPSALTKEMIMLVSWAVEFEVNQG
ncbi:hypothetical protein F0562_013415 [Nyssa sinensis]|uniref:Uncharacterized protein n=1 Tax=Nyssa sinensis TaxID=561372 RepID=A0A5J4ZMI6_9ASTE|nr:hypothetical protein F0562_013415 [Nyssa sinensis]